MTPITGTPVLREVRWADARRIIRSRYPPIALFEDVADPADWPLLIAAEQKTNPRLVEAIGALDLIPPQRRVTGPGASFLMAPFTHTSPDRPSRFSRGEFGVLYVAQHFHTALSETLHHHTLFMRQTAQPPGWTSQFRELVLDVAATLADLTDGDPRWAPALDPDSYEASQILGARLKGTGGDGLVYPSRRDRDGVCVALFYPDLAAHVRQSRHLDYHWDGQRVDLFREPARGAVFRIEAP